MISFLTFPGGEDQIQEEATKLYILLGGKLNKEEARTLLVHTKTLLVIADDKSEERILPSMIGRTENKLTEEEALLAYQHIIGKQGGLYSGGDGYSKDNAVVINTSSSAVGIDAEYKWIEERYGQQDKDWTVELRIYGTRDNGKSFENFVIKLADGTTRKIFFDISSFYG
jgi:hypothetical protein